MEQPWCAHVLSAPSVLPAELDTTVCKVKYFADCDSGSMRRGKAPGLPGVRPLCSDSESLSAKAIVQEVRAICKSMQATGNNGCL